MVQNEHVAQEEQQAQRYPFDFDALMPGDFIGPDVLEKVVQAPKEYSVYAAKCEAIIQRVMKERMDLGVWFENFGIKVGRPEELLSKVKRRIGSTRRKLKWTAAMAMRIPVHQLPKEAQIEAENVIQIAAAQAVVVGGITAKRLAVSGANDELPNANEHLRLIGKKSSKT